MSKILKKGLPWLILCALIIALIPSLANRVTNENKNKNVTISLYYQNLSIIASDKKIDETLDRYLEEGINTVTVKEDDLNYLVSRGDVTSIKYNVLRHKYDDESMYIGDVIANACPDVSGDSHIVMVKRPEMRERIAEAVSLYYTDSDCFVIKDVASMDVYVFYDGRRALWNIAMGYDEALINKLSNKGFDIALMHKTHGYSNTAYLEKIQEIIDANNVKYINVQQGASPYSEKKLEDNYKGIADIINSNDLTLVVTENTNQLSNQQFAGYGYVFSEVMGENGSKKVVRSYETYDVSQEDESHYLFRVQQLLNSTLDRNIRFVNVTQITSETGTYDDCIDYTLDAVKLFKQKIKAEGFAINGESVELDYKADMFVNFGLCAALMVMCVLVMFEMVFGKQNMKLSIAAIVLAGLSFVATYKMPPSLFALYPTVYSVVMSCFAMTSTLCFIKTFKEKLNFALLVSGALLVMLISIFAGSVGMGAMLSGIDYYVNNLIFRGIKLSLLVPVAYTIVVYYLMFVRNEKTNIISDVKKVLFADIKVYWVLIGAVFGAIGIYYIVRSGNVSEISGVEATLRNTLSEIFPARPRTKEFLIGYPALVLFVYYTKNIDIKLIKWILAIAASILAASVTNSFCHVFTDYTFICTRVVNGLLVGLIVSAFAFVANYVLVKIVKTLKAKFQVDMEK